MDASLRQAAGVVMAVAVVWATASPAPARPPDQQLLSEQVNQPVFRTRVALVRVDVSVMDRDGHPIDDLETSDFEILEDGVAQTVEQLQFLRLDGIPAHGSDLSLPIRSREHAEAEAARDDVRIFAVFLDDYHVDKRPAITLPLRSALVHFVEALGPTDLVAVMEPLTSLHDLEFTRSREALVARLRAFEGRRGEIFPIKSPAEEAQLASRDVWRLRAQVTLSALEALTSYLGGLRDGRKSVLFVSQGPPLGPSRELNPDVERILQAANRGNVTINVLDPRRLGEVRFGGDEVARRLAQETGGRAIVNTNDLKGGLDQVVEDASAYYLVGYSPSREFADGAFHRIEVKVTRPGVRVLARRGYWAPSAEEITAAEAAAAAPPVPGLGDALAGLAEPEGGHQVEVWVGLSRGTADRTRLTVMWATPVGRSRPARATSRLEVEPLSRTDATPLAEPQSTADPRDAATFELPPGTIGLRLTALAQDGTVIDRWMRPVTLPDFVTARLSLATPRFLLARTPFEFKALHADAHPPPVVGRVFRRTDRVLVDVECYRADDGAPSIDAHVLNTQGQTLVELQVATRGEGAARVELPVGRLAQGRYVLRVRAREGDQVVEQLSAFEVSG